MSLALAEPIRTYLGGIAGILTYIPLASIYWLEAPETASINRIVFKMISDPPLYDSDDKWQRWRFWVTYENPYGCRRLADEVFDHLNRKSDSFGAFQIDYITGLDSGDPDFIEELPGWQVILDFMIYYH